MTQAELLDALARAIGAPRHDGRHKEIKVAFAALEEHLETNGWIRHFNIKSGCQITTKEGWKREAKD